MRAELHDRLNTGALASQEEWPYMPHLTIVKMSLESQAEEAHKIARERWNHFEGNREIQVNELIFVREEQNRWIDLAGVRLGRQLVNAALNPEEAIPSSADGFTHLESVWLHLRRHSAFKDPLNGYSLPRPSSKLDKGFRPILNSGASVRGT